MSKKKNVSEMKREVTLNAGAENETKVNIVIKKPNNATLKDADRYKSKTWNECIQDDILTKKELAVLMRKRGIWDDKKDKEEKEITEAIVQLEKELYHGKNGKKPKVSEGRDIAVEIRRKRSDLRDLIAEKIGLEENTADNLADNARFDFLVAKCTYKEDGKTLYWKDFDEYNSNQVGEVAYAAAEDLGKMLFNLDTNFEQNLPENLFLKKFNLVNEDLSLVDPNNPDQLIDTKGRAIDEEGFYLDDEGQRVDKDGNAVTEEGNYEMVDYENDLVVKPKRAPRKKKTPQKSELETTETES